MSFVAFSHGVSDIGLVRRRNEDRWGQVPEHAFFVLSDGMGGHLGGDIAAEQSVTQLMDFVREEFPPSQTPARAMARIRNAIDQANEVVYEHSRLDRSLRGMGATLCCLYLCQDQMVYGHVGDSRIYRLRKGRLKRLTRDHSLVTQLLESGQISQEEAESFIYKHIVTRAIGTRVRVEPDLAYESVEDNDLYFMCSDGLTDLVRDDQIELLLNQNPEPKQGAKALIQRVYGEGARDNVTIVMVRIDEDLS